MKKIIMYVDWTDCVAHLTAEYAEGESPKEKGEYTAKQAKNFFAQIKLLKIKGYNIDCHVISGGSVEMLSEMYGQICELAENSGCGDLFKSLTCEYGGDIVTKSGVIENKNADAESLFTNELEEKAKAHFKNEENIFFNKEKYFQNIRFENIDITKQEFEEKCLEVSKIYGHEDFNFYSYFCPGYGVEIDIVPKSLNKNSAVKNINEIFYSKLSRHKIALSIFNGDFAEIDLPMVNSSLTRSVLFVGTEEGNILENIQNTKLPVSIKGKKLEALTLALDDVNRQDLRKHPYDKGDFEYGKTL